MLWNDKLLKFKRDVQLQFMKHLFIFTYLLLSFTNCKKHHSLTPPDNPYGLPNATQTGADIFACRVNGQNWISKEGIYNINGGVSDTSFGVEGSRDISSISREVFIIGIKGFLVAQNSSYRLNDTATQFAEYFGVNVGCFAPNGSYSTIITRAYDGELKLTRVDTVKKILSGTFWFNIKTDYCDTMKVTDGRFDIGY